MELVDLFGEVLVRVFKVHYLEAEIAVLFGQVHVALKDSVVILYFNAKGSILLLQLLNLKFLRFDHLSLSDCQIVGWLRLHPLLLR